MPRERLLTPTFMICFAACFIQAMAFHMYLHLPGFLVELGAGEVMIGWIAAVAAAAAILARPALGRLMDLRGRRIVVWIGGALNTLSLALYLSVDEIGPWIFTVRILQGVSQAMLFSAFFTLAADIVPVSRRTEGIGIFGVSGMLPIGLGPTLGDWILSRGDYADLFLTSVGFGAISLLLSLAIRDISIEHDEDLPARSFRATFLQPDLLPLWFIGAVFTTATSAPFIFLKTYVLESGYGNISYFFVAYSTAAILLRLLAGWLPDRVGAKRIYFPALVVLSLGILQLAQVESSLGLVVAGLTCGFGHGYAIPILTGLIVTRARDSERGAAMSMSTALFDIGFLLGGPALGFVIATSGYAAMFVSASGLILFGLVIFGIWDRKHA